MKAAARQCASDTARVRRAALPRSQTVLDCAFLGIEQFVAVLKDPSTEFFQRTIDEARAELGQLEVDARWRFGVHVTGGEAVVEQSV